MDFITQNIKFITWKDIGIGMRIEYTGEFYLDITYNNVSKTNVSSASNILLKIAFIDNFEQKYGIELHQSNIIIENDHILNKPAPLFKIKEIYIRECDATILLRKLKIETLLNNKNTQ